ncbi:hypothetical protein [Pseudofrankia sp. DC12]|uniref:hypothetical protein n=1 Tax=Pseudofrankia sp. DC12 TaxID=683315 RepID=UPI000A63ADC8|nr:hypothetical protein [Pseudofrankia sp. DC12]
MSARAGAPDTLQPDAELLGPEAAYRRERRRHVGAEQEGVGGRLTVLGRGDPVLDPPGVPVDSRFGQRATSPAATIQGMTAGATPRP